MPYTTNVPGTTITAAWGNANVRDQVVTPFATAAARTSAISSPVEGMLSYRADGDGSFGIFEGYDGAAWYGLARAQPPRTLVTRAAAQSIGNNSATLVSWDTEVTDPDGMITVTATTVTVNSAGLWLLTAGCTFANNATGDRLLFINHNGSELGGGGQSGPASAANTTRLNASQIISAAASDTVTVSVYQNSGGSLNMNVGRLSVMRISL